MATLYIDMMSQPCRAVWMFIKINNLPVKLVQYRIAKGDHRTPAALAMNPLGKLPFLQDGSDYTLTESGPIMAYLMAKFPGQVADHWYPQKCLKTHARVESLMHWHHANTRAGAAGFLFHVWLLPARTGKPANLLLAKQAEAVLRAALATLEKAWLITAAGGTGCAPLCQEGDGMFLGGLTQISVADIQIACELSQLIVLSPKHHGLSMEQLMAPHPAVRAWMARVAEASSPSWDAAHKFLLMAAKMVAAAPVKGADSKL